jgi:hypothetical protein
MRTQKQWLNYQQLELISEQRSKLRYDYQNGLSVFRKLVQILWMTFTAGTEPCIWKTLDRQGQIQWRIYDPRTRQIIQLASEAAVRTWLDQTFAR